MDKLTEVKEPTHEELMKLLNPLVDFMAEHNYNYLMVAGKDGKCTRHMRGRFDDVTGMIVGMMENNKEVEGIIKYSAGK